MCIKRLIIIWKRLTIMRKQLLVAYPHATDDKGMMNLVVLFSLVGYACSLFVIGRFHAPTQERLPLRELDNAAVAHSIIRGWYALSTDNSLIRIINELSPGEPDPGTNSR